MTPIEFMSFRNRLESASGFQSAQFRELEFLLGFKREAMIAHHAASPDDSAKLKKRFEEPTIHWHFYDFIEQHGAKIPQELRDKPHTESIEPNAEIQEALINIYRNDPELTTVLELLTDIDEGIQEWRYRHVKMVERTIGHKMGTGGSEGVEYLKKTLFRSAFPDLWEIRDRL
jgi:tryptophan 2,3-dioxygenase